MTAAGPVHIFAFYSPILRSVWNLPETRLCDFTVKCKGCRENIPSSGRSLGRKDQGLETVTAKVANGFIADKPAEGRGLHNPAGPPLIVLCDAFLEPQFPSREHCGSRDGASVILSRSGCVLLAGSPMKLRTGKQESADSIYIAR